MQQARSVTSLSGIILLREEVSIILRRTIFNLLLLAIVCFVLASGKAVFGQGTSFTYQGRLQDGGTAANGSYDFQFTLWDAASGGTQQPQPSPITVTRTNVQVTSGSFTVLLDFGADAFPGADRYLEISVKTTGSASFTVLSPRASNSNALRDTQSECNRSRQSFGCVQCLRARLEHQLSGRQQSERCDSGGQRASRELQLHSEHDEPASK